MKVVYLTLLISIISFLQWECKLIIQEYCMQVLRFQNKINDVCVTAFFLFGFHVPSSFTTSQEPDSGSF